MHQHEGAHFLEYGMPENIKIRTSGLIRFIVADTSSPLLSGSA
jgi:hypothetical protein